MILTHNEELHLQRAIDSVASFATHILVVDSGSTDRTLDIARASGASVLTHPWVNYATQFNWGLTRIPEYTEWVLRLDADEIVSPDLAEQITTVTTKARSETSGFLINRRMNFMGQPIRYGGLFPVKMLRLFRPDAGRCENRWMDEHIVLSRGRTGILAGEILDDNLKPLEFWKEKHRSYAKREAVDLLNLKHQYMKLDTISKLNHTNPSARKRWIKENVYARLPGRVRATLYFLYRFMIRLGFLDAKSGRQFHYLQAYWYRNLVDQHVAEVERFAKTENTTIPEAIRETLGIDLQFN